MKKKRYDIITCHPGKHHFFEQANVLSQEFDLKFLTSIYFDPKFVRFANAISKRFGSYLNKRTHPELSLKYVSIYPKIALSVFFSKFLKKEYSYYTGNRLFGEWVIRNYPPPKIFIGIDTASLDIFRAWKNKAFLILDLVIALPTYRQKIYNEAKSSLDNSRNDFHFPGKWELEVYKEEVELADLILCGSEFVKESCIDFGVPEEKLKIVEYGSDINLFKRDTPISKPANIFKIAFVGNFSVRKGARLMVEFMHAAASKFPNLELHVFGNLSPYVNVETMPSTKFHGFLPQNKLKQELEMCNALVFPTYFEGSAYSVYQAMSMGLPVITTRNCGSIIDETCGIIIPTNSVKAIEEAVIKLYDDPDLGVKMGEAAITKVQNYTWKEYGRKLVDIINGLSLININ